jgi:glyoxylate/hydroxypyruvate reductase A
MSLLVATRWNSAPWISALQQHAPERRIYDSHQTFDPAAIEYALVWRPEPGFLARLPNLRAVFNLGAGVDALMADATLPDVPVIRISDPDLTRRMTEWVTLQVLYHARQMPAYRQTQAARQWVQLDQVSSRDIRVGIMGIGVLGQDAAEVLIRLGFSVSGWSRNRKEVPGVTAFAGEAELPAFLGRTDILVVLLPLTPETQGILNRELFARLARDGFLGAPVLINAGRGGLQREADILAALDDGTLKGASLDVFEIEPLPVESPLWLHPKVVITPHAAADSTPNGLVPGLLADIARFERGETLPNLVDRKRGY